MMGWRVYHTRSSKGSEPGLMDLIFGRGNKYVCRLLVAELKIPPNEPTEDQVFWLQAFAAAGVPAYRWTPDDWDEIEEALKQR